MRVFCTGPNSVTSKITSSLQFAFHRKCLQIMCVLLESRLLICNLINLFILVSSLSFEYISLIRIRWVHGKEILTIFPPFLMIACIHLQITAITISSIAILISRIAITISRIAITISWIAPLGEVKKTFVTNSDFVIYVYQVFVFLCWHCGYTKLCNSPYFVAL